MCFYKYRGNPTSSSKRSAYSWCNQQCWRRNHKKVDLPSMFLVSFKNIMILSQFKWFGFSGKLRKRHMKIQVFPQLACYCVNSFKVMFVFRCINWICACIFFVSSFSRLGFIRGKPLTWKKLQIFVSWSMVETYLAKSSNYYNFQA